MNDVGGFIGVLQNTLLLLALFLFGDLCRNENTKPRVFCRHYLYLKRQKFIISSACNRGEWANIMGNISFIPIEKKLIGRSIIFADV